MSENGNARASTELNSGDGLTRTDVYCHGCNRTFIARVDFSIDGNHVIECPCGHEHCRTVVAGAVTGDRWDGRYGKVKAGRSVWRHDDLKIETSTAAAFLRDRWLNLEGG